MVTTTVAADGFGTTTTALATTTEAPTTTERSTTSAPTSTIAPASQNTSIYYLKGDKGDKGEQGDPGEDGLDGIDGIGVKGDKGERGEDGYDGIDGKDGLDGINGQDGRDGRDAPTPIEDVFDEVEQSNKKIQWHQLDEDVTFVISFGSTAFVLALVNLTCTVWLCWKRLTRGDLNYAKLKETELKAMHMA